MKARAIGRWVTPRRLLLVVAVLALLWTSGILLVPVIESSDNVVAATAAGVARLAYRPACHQIVDRSLTLGGRPLAVCARCTGLYLGGVAALVLVALANGRLRVPGRVWLAVAVAPTVLDFGIGLLSGYGLPNLPRLLLALPAGLMLGWYLAEGVASLAGTKPRGSGEPTLPRSRRPTLNGCM